jgi:hypothetical protein
MIGWEGTFLNLEWRTYQKTNSHRTLRDGSSRTPFLAVNCQATIIPSLRDKTTDRLFHVFDSTSRFEDEDDDEYEDEAKEIRV